MQNQLKSFKLNKIEKANQLKIQRITEDVLNKNKGNIEVNTFFNQKEESKKYKISQQLKDKLNKNIILLNCIDTNGNNSSAWIKAEDIRNYNVSCLVGKNTSRNIASVILPEFVTLKEQEYIINQFNKKLNKMRKKYKSLFLTNFRDNDRKRVSFEFCYKLISYCFDEMIKENLFVKDIK